MINVVPSIFFAYHRYVSMKLFDQAVSDGKPQSGSLAPFFGSEKRFEYFRQVLLGHAASIIADGNADLISTFECRIDSQVTAAIHRLEGIVNQIQEHLLQLSTIGFNFGNILRQCPRKRSHFDIQPLYCEKRVRLK